MSSEDAEKLAAMKLEDELDDQSTTDTSETSSEEGDTLERPAEQPTDNSDESSKKTGKTEVSEEPLTDKNDESVEKAHVEKPDEDSISDMPTIDQTAEKLSGENIPLASEESDFFDYELEPCDDYERFLHQFSNADTARRMLLHSINARVAEHEHKANCWKVIQVDDSTDLKKLFEIFMKREGSQTLEEFENNAFMKSYATPEYVPEAPTTSYAEHMEQFLPGIPIRNYFPELGPVDGEVPYCMSTDADMMNPQPPIILDPSAYEVQFKKTKVEKAGHSNKKKKTTTTKTEKVEPQPLFLKEHLTKCIAVSEWAERYSSCYSFQPAKELILRELEPKRYKTVVVPQRSVQCGLISKEFDTVLAEYQESLNPQKLQLAPSLASKYIEKRLAQLDSNSDPTIITAYQKMKSVLDDEIVAAVNAINRYRSDDKKFDRLEKILYIKYYDL